MPPPGFSGRVTWIRSAGLPSRVALSGAEVLTPPRLLNWRDSLRPGRSRQDCRWLAPVRARGQTGHHGFSDRLDRRCLATELDRDRGRPGSLDARGAIQSNGSEIAGKRSTKGHGWSRPAGSSARSSRSCGCCPGPARGDRRGVGVGEVPRSRRSSSARSFRQASIRPAGIPSPRGCRPSRLRVGRRRSGPRRPVGSRRCPNPPQVDDRIGDQLARAVVGDPPATPRCPATSMPCRGTTRLREAGPTVRSGGPVVGGMFGAAEGDHRSSWRAGRRPAVPGLRPFRRNAPAGSTTVRAASPPDPFAPHPTCRRRYRAPDESATDTANAVDAVRAADAKAQRRQRKHRRKGTGHQNGGRRTAKLKAIAELNRVARLPATPALNRSRHCRPHRPVGHRDTARDSGRALTRRPAARRLCWSRSGAIAGRIRCGPGAHPSSPGFSRLALTSFRKRAASPP